MKPLKLYILNSLYKRILQKKYYAFMKSLSESQSIQQQYLINLVRSNVGTDYGKKYGFRSIRTPEDFFRRVPLITYDDIAHDIDRMKNGEQNVLFQEKILMFEKTSGSIAATKYIPFNRTLLKEIHNGTSAWIYDIYKRFRNLGRTTAYWSISPKLGSQEYTESGIKVGFADDSEYFSPLEQKFLKHLLTVDPCLSKLDKKKFRTESALSLIGDGNLGLISIWNPTFFLLILEYIEICKERLLRELRKRPRRLTSSRLNHIEKIFTTGDRIDFQALWPKLELISCWTDGSSSMFVPPLKAFFPDVHIQAKGLLMTEGVVTVPMIDLEAPVLCVNSHFYEFLEIPDDQSADIRAGQKTLLPHQLEEGRDYTPVITTSGGLYRYITNDRVRVKGFHQQVPLLRFMGRCNNIVDLCGEKLNETFVEKTIIDLSRKYELNPDFTLVALTLTAKPHYIFFIEDKYLNIDLNEMASEFDELLCRNHHYNLCRKLGQLAPLEVTQVEQGRSTYVKALIENKKQNYGDIKNKILDSNLFWKDSFKTVKNRLPV